MPSLSNFPSNLFWRIRYAIRKLLGRPLPKFTEFYALPSQELRRNYTGTVSDLFFENKERLVHKWLHYLPIYDRSLGPYAGSAVRMLEIGVYQGGSLDLWRKFLGPGAVIFGIDIDAGCAQFDGIAGKVRIGSQDDPVFLRKIVQEMGGLDIVLDDGSHVASHQRASFEVLFPLLSDSELYIIEDLHTSYWPWLGGGLRRKGTGIEFLKSKIDDMHRHYLDKDMNSEKFIPEIESIQFFDSIAVVVKKRQLPRHHVKIPPPP